MTLCLVAGCAPPAVEPDDVQPPAAESASSELPIGVQPAIGMTGDDESLVKTASSLDAEPANPSASDGDPFAATPSPTHARQRSRIPRSSQLEFQESFQAGRYPAALKAVRDMLRERPDDPDLLYLLAMTYRADADPRRAEPALNRALEIDPAHVPARKLLCVILTEDGRCDDAAIQIDRLVDSGDADAEAYLLRAAARLRCGELAAAEQDADEVLRLDPGKSQALLVRAAARLRGGRIDPARDDLEAARRAGLPDSQWQPLAAELEDAAGKKGP